MANRGIKEKRTLTSSKITFVPWVVLRKWLPTGESSLMSGVIKNLNSGLILWSIHSVPCPEAEAEKPHQGSKLFAFPRRQPFLHRKVMTYWGQAWQYNMMSQDPFLISDNSLHSGRSVSHSLAYLSALCMKAAHQNSKTSLTQVLQYLHLGLLCNTGPQLSE